MIKAAPARSAPAGLRQGHSSVVARPAVGIWNWISALSLVSAVGLLAIALADAGALRELPWAEALFWAGLLIVVVPTALRLASARVLREERIGLVLLLGLSLYLVKIMNSPFDFTYSDELVHMGNVNMILGQHHLFGYNAVLPVTSYYPGLETLTAAFSSLSGLSVVDSGLIVIGVARVILFLGVFLVTEQLSRSDRVAAIATLLYMCHSNFVFWSAQFSYESLSLPLATMCFYAIMRREETKSRVLRFAFTVVSMLVIMAIVATHHVTSYFLVILLIVWTLFARLRAHVLLARVWQAVANVFGRNRRAGPHARRRAANDAPNTEATPNAWTKVRHEKGPIDLALFALLATAVWIIFVANITVTYLQTPLMKAVLSVIRLALNEETSRQLFVSNSGDVAPLWERLIGTGSVVLGLIGLPFGLYQVYRHRADHPLILVFGISAIAYFGILGLRFTADGWETANRASEYLYLGLAFVLALGITEVILPHLSFWLGRAMFAGYVAVLFMGGIISGWVPALRLPQPYVVSVGNQVLMPQGVSVAEWTRDVLGPDHVVAADASNVGLLMAYGGQHPLSGRDYNVNVLLSQTHFSPFQAQSIAKGYIDYILVDRRQISTNNMLGIFFNRTGGQRPILADWLEPDVYQKWDKVPDVNRVLDSGVIVMYDVEVYQNGTTSP